MIRPRGSAGSQAWRRSFDFTCAAAGLLVLWPMLLGVSLLITLLDGTPVLFRQVRIGRGGRPFRILKFRTMRAGSTGRAITAAGDTRITAIGAVLRKYKLDELPQLINVLCGDMSLVGPRPEVPEYVDLDSPVWHTLLQVRPGITDLASLLYRNEEHLLQSQDSDAFYREHVQPAKLNLNLGYLNRRSFWGDLRLIVLTVRYSLFPDGFDPARVSKAFHTGA
jgi:lipopolysaccharide/colanic/teichoic acid biosynthesis glycosyltransferase